MLVSPFAWSFPLRRGKPHLAQGIDPPHRPTFSDRAHRSARRTRPRQRVGGASWSA
ncbi:hypothetical protein ACFFX0_20975 [Citricoccus parietis]|uniref:Uncharacterized protein n=1 Tax=Citricoccus parietis TaxID=592307 RepID=A0ABV5G3L0_9MICC